MNNQRGFIIADFMFSLVLILGFTAVLFAISLSLVAASITQYVTFAAARNYVVGHLSQDTQTQQATAKFSQLVSNPVFAPIFKNGWFSLSSPPQIGDISQVIPGYQSNGSDPNLFWGVGTYFTANILDFEIPFFGSTDPNGDGTGSDFKTFMGSYLGRDISTTECMSFNQQRWTKIQGLANTSFSTAQGQFVAMTDDGC